MWCGEKSTVELRSKVLAFGKTQINLVILSLNRILHRENVKDTIMEAKRTAKQVIDWLKAAEKRQQDWQQEVKKRWAEKNQPQIVAAV